MTTIIDILFQSGKSAVELSLYVLLPIMVVMLAPMKLLEEKGGLKYIEEKLAPLCRPFGIPGKGVLALLQSLLVSFAAPVATLAIMENDKTPKRQIAATFAMVLTVSQANVVFPLVTVGLNPWVTLATSLVGGISASAVTYYYFARSADDCLPEAGSTEADSKTGNNVEKTPQKRSFLSILLDAVRIPLDGAQEGMQIALKSIPVLVLAFCFVNLLKAIGVTAWVEPKISGLLSWMRLPGSAVLPIVTKYIAGGTAMMGITIPLVKEGSITNLALNRLAGLAINPLDPVGVAVLVTAGPRVASVIGPACMGAIVGILIRVVLHFIVF